MVLIIIDDKETIAVVMKPVGLNGQISIGTEFASKPIIAYIIEDKRDYAVDDKNSKRKKECSHLNQQTTNAEPADTSR